jgi:hypothetical protein
MAEKLKYNDYPIASCMETVKPFLEAGCHFNQKFSCAHCGSRQTMAQHDQFFASGQCEECGHVTDLKHRGCNYLLVGPLDEIERVKKLTARLPHVIRVVAFANGKPCPIAGEWVQTFDHDGADGRGDGVFTNNPKRAMAFESKYAALTFWNKVSTVKPVREDGEPNKPLTACTCEIEPQHVAVRNAKERQ